MKSFPPFRWYLSARSFVLGAALVFSTAQAKPLKTVKAAPEATNLGNLAADINASDATLVNVHVFSSPIGQTPASTLTIDSAGNFYGAAQFGGADNAGTVFQVAADGTATTLYSFSLDGLGLSVNGYDPQAAPLLAPDGFLYGTTTAGGTNEAGTIYRLDPTTGLLATLASFDASTTGSSCVAPLVSDGNGNFYGVTQAGGANNDGALFVFDTATGMLTAPVTFAATTGSAPSSALLLAADGNLYGTATGGGSNQYGTAFQYNPKTGVLTVLENFDSATTGASPSGPLVSDGQGNFFGTTQSGGSQGGGTVYELTVNTASSPLTTTFTTLFNFVQASTLADSTTTTAPSAPSSGVLFGTDGNLYGTSSGGDYTITSFDPGQPGFVSYYGAVFQVLLNTPDANGNPATVNTAFTNYGVNVPASPLVMDAAGHIFVADSGADDYNSGSILELTPAAGSSPRTYAVSTFYSFGMPDGQEPEAALTLGSDGNLYGTTTEGGLYNAGDGDEGNGIVFVYQPRTSVTTTLYRFVNSSTVPDGTDPYGNLVEAAPGVFYGTTSTGGVNLYGTIFRLNTATDPVSGAITGTVTTLYSFSGTTTDGSDPQAGLTQAADGTFYGATYEGGANGYGVIFHFDPAKGTVTTTANFTGTVPVYNGSDQGYPSSKAGLILAKDGTFYGTTQTGGTDNFGSLYRFDPVAGTITTVFNFTGNGGVYPNGAESIAPLLQGANGLLYGTTQYGGPTAPNGTLFQFDPVTSQLTTLYNFGGADGASPSGQLVQTADGNVYGTSQGGGPEFVNSSGGGAIYQYNPSTGALVTLIDASQAAGQDPAGGLTLAADGSLYGTTSGATFYDRLGATNATAAQAQAGGTTGAVSTNATIVGNANGDKYGTIFEVSSTPTVTIAVVGNGEAVEGGAAGKAFVQRTGDASAALTVFYKVRGSAQSGVEYKPVTGSVTIPAGATKAKIKIKPLDNPTNEGTLVAKIKLKPSTGGSYILGSTTVAKIQVIDND